MKSKTIYLIRHPETDWNRQRRYQGRTARPLTGRGEISALGVVEWMREHPPAFIASSPTAHAGELARRIVRDVESVPEPVFDDGWCEVDHGAWEGLLHDEVEQRFGGDAVKRFEDPRYDAHGGESLAQVDSRVGRAWRSLVTSPGGVTAVVSHATPIRIVLCRCLGLSVSSHWRFRVDNSSVTRIDVAGNSTVIGFVNRRVRV